VALLSSRKKKAAPKRAAPKRTEYEPSHFVWLQKYNGEPRQPALVLYGADADNMLVVYVTPTLKKGDTGRRDVPYSIIEGRITP
jgi:hypothetical protein